MLMMVAMATRLVTQRPYLVEKEQDKDKENFQCQKTSRIKSYAIVCRNISEEGLI